MVGVSADDADINQERNAGKWNTCRLFLEELYVKEQKRWQVCPPETTVEQAALVLRSARHWGAFRM